MLFVVFREPITPCASLCVSKTGKNRFHDHSAGRSLDTRPCTTNRVFSYSAVSCVRERLFVLSLALVCFVFSFDRLALCYACSLDDGDDDDDIRDRADR